MLHTITVINDSAMKTFSAQHSNVFRYISCEGKTPKDSDAGWNLNKYSREQLLSKTFQHKKHIGGAKKKKMTSEESCGAFSGMANPTVKLFIRPLKPILSVDLAQWSPNPKPQYWSVWHVIPVCRRKKKMTYIFYLFCL